MLHMYLNKAIKFKEQVPVSGPHRTQWPVYGEYTYIPAHKFEQYLECDVNENICEKSSKLL